MTIIMIIINDNKVGTCVESRRRKCNGMGGGVVSQSSSSLQVFIPSGVWCLSKHLQGKRNGLN